MSWKILAAEIPQRERFVLNRPQIIIALSKGCMICLETYCVKITLGYSLTKGRSGLTVRASNHTLGSLSHVTTSCINVEG